MSIDSSGHPLSSGSPTTIQRYEKAVRLMNAYQADPIVEIDGLLAEHLDFVMGHAFRAGALALAGDKAFEPEMRRSLAAAEALADKANERERGHIRALQAFRDGDWTAAVEAWGRVATDYPRDIVAVQFAQLGDFFLGQSHMLRDRVARVLPQWSASVPGYGYVLGMYAFGLEEAGEYERADHFGRSALVHDAQDAWAAHAVAHVMEMQGRHSDGRAWLRETASGWASGLFAFHNWWHLALFHLETGEAADAFELFDAKVSAGGFPQALELVDGSALLWRLFTLGHDAGAARWTPVAEKWLTRVSDGFYAFNDVHAMMAFVGAGWVEAQKQLLAAMTAALDGSGVNAMMTREIGLPAALGIQAFGQGDYARALKLLMPLQGKANRFGGSHAQRDIFSWTLTEAAIRAGDKGLAQGLIAERLARKPQSPLNAAWFNREREMEKQNAA